MLMLETCQG